jgi:hypothetical protein
MRTTFLIVPLMMCSAPVLAQAAPTQRDTAEMQRVLNDPAMADKLAKVMQAMSQAFLDLPAGEVQAAMEGRTATPAEKRLTVRDMARKEDPNFDRDFQQQIAQARPMVEHGMKALSTALPAMTQALQQAGKAIERAAANMPDPTYPRR